MTAQHNVHQQAAVARRQYKTYTKNFSFCAHCRGSNIARVDTSDSTLLRIRPLHYDERYTIDEIKPWKMTVRGKEFHPLLKEPLSPFALSYKKRVYSPNRIPYPLQRVDWNPDGDRNTDKRGKSKFKRISWKRALESIAAEIKRIQKQYGTSAIYLMMGNHGETKCIHGPHGTPVRLIKEGYTIERTNPDSWEGWYWGAQHVWGMDCPWTDSLSVGTMAPQTNVIKDISENAELVLFIGCDPKCRTGAIHWLRPRNDSLGFSGTDFQQDLLLVVGAGN